MRKSDPKPLKIYMEDGVNDELPSLGEIGDWAMSNQTMEKALTFAGYDVTHMWGAGDHNNAHAGGDFSGRDEMAVEGLSGADHGESAGQSGLEEDRAAG